MTMLWYTPGPASEAKESAIMEAGASGVRLTFSYSTPVYQAERARLHRSIAAQLGREFMIVADLAGEKFRLGRFLGESSVQLRDGEPFGLVPGEVSDPVNDRTLAVTSEGFFAGLRTGDLITVGDGSAVLRVSGSTPRSARLVVEQGGTVNQSRGLTVQGSNFRPACLTEKDLADLRFIADSGEFDAVALSFVSGAGDIKRAREIVATSVRPLTIVAKVETQAGIDNIDEICSESDMVMAARGDLALAIPWVELPGAVVKIEQAALSAQRPWISATQVVEGLERFVIPTRAEICDLANWMQRGCSGVLISYETAFGANPVGAVRATRQIMDRWQR